MEAGRLPVAPPVDRPRETLRQIGHVAHEAFAARDGAGDSPVRRTSAIGGMIDKATFLRQQPVQERIHSLNRLHSYDGNEITNVVICRELYTLQIYAIHLYPTDTDRRFHGGRSEARCV